MPDLLERMKSALADRYAIESEIDRGGMAVVFLAEDLKHHRKVALKVLHPELTATLGAERFPIPILTQRSVAFQGGRSGRGYMNVAAVRAEPDRFAVVRRTELFDAGPFQEEWNRNFDVHPDGQEFVMVSRPVTQIVWRVNALAAEP